MAAINHSINKGNRIMRTLMRKPGRRHWKMLALAGAFLLPVGLDADASAAEKSSARQILDTAGVQRGFVVHLGCADGKLTAALAANKGLLVQGLDTDADNVATARQYIGSLDMGGRVSVELFDGNRLPYVDNLVNLIVAEDLGHIDSDELMRVLAPRGVLCFKKDDRWTKTVKPRPDGIDDWTHYLHDAGGNAVADDTLVGPPKHMQWLTDPIWCRNHHTLASISSVVTTGGRIFYIVDEGPAATTKVTGKWSVVGRDAFNGLLLWQRPIGSWAKSSHRFRSGPVQLPRTLVVQADRLYVPLGMGAAVSALDAATGETLATYPQTKNAEEVIVHNGVLLAVTGSPGPEQASIDAAWQPIVKFPNQKSMVAIDLKSGRMLWKHSPETTEAPVPLTLAAKGNRVFFSIGSSVLCLDEKTGKQIWRWSKPGADKPKQASKPTGKQTLAEKRKARKRRRNSPRSEGWSLETLVVRDGVLLWADGKKLRAFVADDGRPLWDCQCPPGFRSPSDVFVISGLVWIGPSFTEGRDLHSGQIKQTSNAVDTIWTVGHHHRCYREKATVQYILSGHRGIEFLDLKDGQHSRNNWVRGVCQYGVMPANGLIYAPSHACGCFMEAKLFGFWALSAKRKAESRKRMEQGNRLFRGPAYAQANPTSDLRPPTSKDWPTLRGDPLRSGSTTTPLAPKLDEVWQTELQGPLSAPVVAGGTVLVSQIDAHRVVALDAATGKPRWSFTAGGRVDSPPTVYRNLALFGCRDGHVYALRMSDGQLAWRFRAASQTLNTVVRNQVESIWPVHGNVLVQDDRLYTAAGRSSYLDGGIRVFVLNPLTGELIAQSLLRNNHPTPNAPSVKRQSGIKQKQIVQNATDYKTFTDPDLSDAFSMDGALTDVFVGDGTSVYMRQLKFNRDGKKQKQHGRHLFSTTRLLDDAEVHRSHWALGTGDFRRIPVAYSWIANTPKGSWTSRMMVPHGIMLSFDDETVWGVRRTKSYDYQLFAEANRPFSPAEEALPDFRQSDNKAGPAFKWLVDFPMRPRAMLRVGGQLVIGGMPKPDDPIEMAAAYEGRKGGLLWTMSTRDGEKLTERRLDAPPVFDGMAAVAGRLYIVKQNGEVVCLAGR